MYTGGSPTKRGKLGLRSGDHARNSVPPSKPNSNHGGARAGGGRPKSTGINTSAAQIIQVGQALLKNKDREVENSDPEDSEQMCSQKEKLQELKLLATDSGVELRTKESWRTLFSMVVMCMLAGWKQTTAIAKISKLACVKATDLTHAFQHFSETSGVLVTDSKCYARVGEENGRVRVKQHMRTELPRLIETEILGQNVPLTSMAVGALIAQTWFEGQEGIIGDKQVWRIMSDLGYEWANLSKHYVETRERKASLCSDMAKGMQLPRSGIWVGLWKRRTIICAARAG